MRKPRIGIVLDLARDSDKYSYSAFPWYALRKCYADCVSDVGGIPIMLPYHPDIDELLNLVDGLIIPGGDEDIHPKFYGQEITSSKVKTNDIRANFELTLAKKAMDRNIPLLGICNGLQVINVACGGTLIQDISAAISTEINHEQPPPKNMATHPILIMNDTILSTMTTDFQVKVNSTHHQAIDQVGTGLIISARAPDGIIEAVESNNYRYLIGIQWHAEYLNSELDRNLFKRLIEASTTVV